MSGSRAAPRFTIALPYPLFLHEQIAANQLAKFRLEFVRSDHWRVYRQCASYKSREGPGEDSAGKFRVHVRAKSWRS